MENRSQGSSSIRTIPPFTSNEGQLNERKTMLTMFPLLGLEHTSLKITTLLLNERVPDSEDLAVYMEKWAKSLTRKLHCPVVPKPNLSDPGFFIPSNCLNGSIEFPELPYDQKITFHIILSNQTVEIKPHEATREQLELMCRMIEKSIAGRLKSPKLGFWHTSPTSFYFERTLNFSNTYDEVNAYRGVSFKVIPLNDGLYVSFDMHTRYVGRKSLRQYSEGERETKLRNHMKHRKGQGRFLRDNGILKFDCRYVGPTGKTASKYFIEKIQETVYDYYRDKYPDLNIDPNEPVVYVAKETPVPESRLFPIFTTEDDAVKGCSIKPQISPYQRYKQITQIIETIGSFRFGSQNVKIGMKPMTVTEEVMGLPPLVFANGNILNSDGIGVSEYNSQKIAFLKRFGPFANPPVPPITLLFPDTFSTEDMEIFERIATDVIKELSGQKVSFDRLRSYGTQDVHATILAIKEEFDSTIQSNNSTMFICVLWNRFDGEVYRNLKEIFGQHKSQFIRQKTLIELLSGIRGSKLENVALAIMIEAGIKPWALDAGLHSDLHLGIDLLFGNIGSCAIYGKKAELEHIEFKKNFKKGRAKESIGRNTLKSMVKEQIENLFDDDIGPSLIVIHRDGRWWPSESDGLSDAIKELEKEQKTILKYVVVEIRKDHFPVRMFSSSGRQNWIANSTPGTFFEMGPDTALIVNSGVPGNWDAQNGKTARPLLIKVAASTEKTDIRVVLKDIFHLTNLNWSAPKINIRLPVTIDWLDAALRGKWIEDEQEEE